jgi:hypothetical protein
MNKNECYIIVDIEAAPGQVGDHLSSGFAES